MIDPPNTMVGPLAAALTRRPFLPFRFGLTSGQIYEVNSPIRANVRGTVLDLNTRPDPSAPPNHLIAVPHVTFVEPLRPVPDADIALSTTD